jgi:ribosome assembly protein RRB1
MSSNDPSEQSKINKLKKAKKKRSKAKKQAAAATPVAPTSAPSFSNPPLDTTKRVQFVDPPSKPPALNEDEAGLDFEDPFEDEFEDEEEDEANDDGMEVEDKQNSSSQKLYFNPHTTTTEQALEFDPSAYGALHQMKFEWPALSFDFFRDHMGSDRTRFPTSVWFVAGSQALEGNENALNLIRVSHLSRTTKEEDVEDGMVVEDEDEELDPTMEHRTLHLIDGAVNRVRAMPQEAGIVACWSESGKVHLYDARHQMQTLHLESSTAATAPSRDTPVYSMNRHTQEGYALDWSPLKTGRLATGDCSGKMYMWDVDPVGGVALTGPFVGHKGSVEDVQFSPSQESYLASCSVDGTIKIWDCRLPERKPGLTQHAHDQDVNVLSWNPKIEYLLASGSDDGSFKVWDLRRFETQTSDSQVAWFKGFHTEAITSLHWSPHDESVLAACSADHQTTIWDMALEEDREFARQASGELGFSEDVLDEDGQRVHIPPQLLFVHSGVRDPKEVRFHPQVVGLVGVTGESGFDLFLCEPLDPKSQLV